MSDGVEVKVGADTSDLSRGFKDASEEIKTFLQSMSADLNKVGTVSADATEKIGQSNKKVQDSNKKTADSFTGMSQQIKSGLESIVTAYLSFEGMKALGAKMFGAIEMAASLEEMSQKLGIATRDLAAYQVVSAQYGLTLDSMAMGMRRLSTYMVDHSDKLRAAGITAKDANGALLQLSDMFHAMPDGPLKAATAVQLFGRAGLQMIPMLNQGSEELAKQLGIARELNPVTEEMAAKAHQFEMALATLKTQINFVWIELSQKMLPGLQRVVQEMQKGAQAAGALGAAWGGIKGFFGMDEESKGAREMQDLLGRKLTFEKEIATLRAKSGGDEKNLNVIQRQTLKAEQDGLAGVIARMRELQDLEKARTASAAPKAVSAAESAKASASAQALRLIQPKGAGGGADEKQKLFDQQNADMLRSLQISDENQQKEQDTADSITRKQILDGIAEKKKLYAQMDAELQKSLVISDANKKKETDASNEAVLKSDKNAWDAIQKGWKQLLDPIKSAFDTSINGIIMGTTTLQRAMQNIFQSIVLSFVKMGVSMAENWAITQLTQTQATALGVSQRGALEEMAAAKSLATSAATALKSIATYAATAFAGEVAFLAPMLGPMAVPAALGIDALVLAAGKRVVSASGGYDIPSGINPLVQAHSQEMILPASLANAVRGMASGGGGGGGDHYHLHGIVDGEGVKSFLMRHGPAVADTMRRQARNLAPTTPR